MSRDLAAREAFRNSARLQDEVSLAWLQHMSQQHGFQLAAANSSQVRNSSIQLPCISRPVMNGQLALDRCWNASLSGSDQQQRSSLADVDLSLSLSLGRTATCTSSCSPELTVFYAGKVSVFGNMPAEKAEQIMLFAATIAADSSKSLQTASSPSTPRIVPHSALPQARKASLARFLEKRKERCATASPYPVRTKELQSPLQSATSPRALKLRQEHTEIF